MRFAADVPRLVLVVLVVQIALFPQGMAGGAFHRVGVDGA